MTARKKPARAKKRTALKPRKKSTPPLLTAPDQRVLGLDVSSQTIGWCLFDQGRLLAKGKWHPEGKDKCHGHKLASYRQWLLEMLAAHRPHQLVSEVPYSGRRRFTYGILMMYLGVTISVHHEWFGVEMPPENRIMPHAVKRLLEAKKGVSYEQRKKQMVLLINALYGLDLAYKPKDKGRVSDDDIADAIALVHAWHLRTERNAAED